MAGKTKDQGGAEFYRVRLARLKRGSEEWLDCIGEKLGGWGDNEADTFAVECGDALREKGELAGAHFDYVYMHLRNANERDTYEYDIVGVGKKRTMVMNVREAVRAEEVYRLADECLPAFAGLFPNHAKGRKVSGAVIFRRAPLEKMPDGTTADPIAIALQKGIIPVQATGKSRLQPITDPSKVRR